METYMTDKGRITIPVAVRRKLGIRAGTRIHVYEENGKIMLRPITCEFIHMLRGKYKGRGLLKALMGEKRRQRELRRPAN